MKTRSGVENGARPFGSDLTNLMGGENMLGRSEKEQKKVAKGKGQGQKHDATLEYIDEILTFCSELGPQNRLPSQDMQTEITHEVRRILLTWVIEVHTKFQFRYETLFLTIQLIDSYTRQVTVRKSDYQLLGLTCLFMAGKYEEIDTPRIKRIAALCDRLFSIDDMLRMEGYVLTALNFHVSAPTLNWFVNGWLGIMSRETCKFTKKFRKFCQYLMELSLLEQYLLKYSNRVLGAAIIHSVSLMEDFLRVNTCPLVQQLNARELRDMKQVVKIMTSLYKERLSDHNEVINRKYADLNQ